MQSNFIIANNVFSYHTDDGIDIHNQPYPFAGSKVLSASATEAIIELPAANPNCWDINLADAPMVGDKFALLNQGSVLLDTAEITAADIPCLTKSDNESLNAPWTYTLKNCASGNCQKTFGNLSDTDQYADLTKQSASGYFISGNTFWANRGHGVLISAPYGLISDNKFWLNNAGNLAFDDIGEGYGSSNLTISDNIMAMAGWSPAIGASDWINSGVGLGMEASPVFRDIAILGNKMSNTYGAAIAVSSAQNLTIRNNAIENSDLYPNVGQNLWQWYGHDSLIFSNISNGLICGTELTGHQGPVALGGVKNESICQRVTP